MTPDTVIDIGQNALLLLSMLLLLLLIPALIIGVLVSIFQAATQINEMTLSFIPKLLVTVLVLILGGPLMLRLLIDYTIRLFDQIPSLIG